MGKQIRLMGKRVTVIGVMEKQGESAFSPSKDNLTFILINLGHSVYGTNSNVTTTAIIIKPDPYTDSEHTKLI